jgi:hypothetical protein
MRYKSRPNLRHDPSTVQCAWSIAIGIPMLIHIIHASRHYV